MDNGDIDRIEEAIAWHHALARDDADWDRFTAWLEADPANRTAYDEIASIDAAVDAHRDTILAILPSETGARESRPSRRWALGAGVAAALALVVGIPLLQTPQEKAVIYTTRPAETKAVALADGTRIALSADSAISVGGNQREITLQRGAAYFDVPHDPTRQLSVTAGGYRITDIGTHFSIDSGGGRVAIAVADGTVTVTQGAGGRTVLAAGQRLIGNGEGAPMVSPIASADVASWRQGRLVYDNASLAVVAADISRYRGTPVSVDPALAERRFSGVLVIGDGTRLVSDLASVAGLRVDRRGDRIVLGGKPS